MSVELVKEQVQRFLSSDTPEVLAIKGGWGVGKTYSWQKYACEFKNHCAVNRYSYVSLFGINSIEEIKKATFLNTIDTHNIGQPLNISSRSKKWAESLQGLKLKGVSVGDVLGSVSQLTMDKTIICFDDLERHSKGVTIKDFMGLVSYFKEQKGCKVVLLLNEDAGDETFADYRKYKEKIIDRQLHFEPTAEQCFDAVWSGDLEFKEFIKDCCVGLKIKNMRVLKKVIEHIKEFLELVEGFDDSIKKQVIHTTVVLSWCYYCHGSNEENIPSFEYAASQAKFFNKDRGTDKPDKEQKWGDILASYGYQHTDNIDASVAKGIQQGFVDKTQLLPLCQEKQKEIDVRNQSASWDDAWKLFHGSFNLNEDEVAKAFEKGARDIVSTTTCSQYSDGLKVLRVIGKKELADELIELFITKHSGNPEKFNLSNFSTNPFGVKDKKFEQRLRQEYKIVAPEMTVDEVLTSRRGSSSYHDSEAKVLNKLSTEQIYDLFMSFKGEEVTDYIRVFKLLSNSSSELGKKVKEALDRIAGLSDLNKDRMAKFEN
ncbi:hypothetical protein AB6C53_09035 [Vibrio splendidus]